MSTVTVTVLRTIHRPRALSLIAARLPPILNLPAELVLSIFELVISESKPTTLATICKGINKAVEIILYRTVVLDTSKTIDLFHRTTLSRPRGFFTEHVKKLIVTWEFEQHLSSISKIIAACPALRSLVSPSCHPISMAMQMPNHDGPSELTFRSYEGEGASKVVPPFQKISGSLTHLRFCEPSDDWYSPSSMLSMFGPLPHLSHLQLSRRADANEDNDLTFAEDIRMLLRSNSTLKVVVVSIFVGYSWTNSSAIAEDSYIWHLMRSIQDEDPRVVIINGVYDVWRDVGNYQKALWSGWHPVDFWTTVKG